MARQPKHDLHGRSFTRWTVLNFAGFGDDNSARWNCRCECGNVQIVRQAHLTIGQSKSCGCLRTELQVKRQIIHGCSGERGTATPTYISWFSMINRCENPKYNGFKYWGGRGIAVCAEKTLDRWPNKDGNYEPGNCRWASRSEQQRNRRTKDSWSYATLDATKVSQIRKLIGSRSMKQLATEFGVSLSAMYLIRNRQTWRHVP